MDKNSIFKVHKSEKRRIMEFDAGLQNIGLNIWGPHNVGLIIWGQQGNSGMNHPCIESYGLPPWEDISKIICQTEFAAEVICEEFQTFG